MKRIAAIFIFFILLVGCNNSGKKAGETDTPDTDSSQHYYIIDTTMTAPAEDPEARDTTTVKKDKMDGASLSFPDKSKRDSATGRK